MLLLRVLRDDFFGDNEDVFPKITPVKRPSAMFSFPDELAMVWCGVWSCDGMTSFVYLPRSFVVVVLPRRCERAGTGVPSHHPTAEWGRALWSVKREITIIKSEKNTNVF